MDPFKPTSFSYTLGETTADTIKVVKAQPPSEVNYFAFELESRTLIDKLLKPIIEEQNYNKTLVMAQKYEITRLQ